MKPATSTRPGRRAPRSALYYALNNRATAAAAVLFTATAISPAAMAQSAGAGGVSCEYVIQADWGGGFVGGVRITNNSQTPVDGWELSWEYDSSTLNHVWNASLSGTNPYTATNAAYNGVIQPGQTVELGFIGDNDGPTETPVLSGGICSDVTGGGSDDGSGNDPDDESDQDAGGGTDADAGDDSGDDSGEESGEESGEGPDGSGDDGNDGSDGGTGDADDGPDGDPDNAPDDGAQDGTDGDTDDGSDSGGDDEDEAGDGSDASPDEGSDEGSDNGSEDGPDGGNDGSGDGADGSGEGAGGSSDEAVSACFTDTAVGLNLSSNASCSEGVDLTFSWIWGDGSTGSGVSASHTYAEAGTYMVMLSVTDGEDTDEHVTNVSVRASSADNGGNVVHVDNPFAGADA